MRLMSVAVMLAVAGLVAACQTNDLKQAPTPLGNFQLGVNVAITDKMQVPGISRQVTPAQMEAAITKAVADRFEYPRYQGDNLLNIGVYVDGYLLAPPGVPIVLSPASVMIVTVNVFDDSTGQKLNEGQQMTVIEKGSANTFIGSGLTQTKEKQLETLAYNVAKRIELYLLENPSWIGMTEEEAKAALATANGTAPASAPEAPVVSVTQPPAASK